MCATQHDGQGEALFDENILAKPAFGSTWAPSLVKSAIGKVTGQTSGPVEVHENDVDETTTASETEASDAAATGIEKATGKKRKGGKRK
jgi:hypothetical protein